MCKGWWKQSVTPNVTIHLKNKTKTIMSSAMHVTTFFNYYYMWPLLWLLLFHGIHSRFFKIHNAIMQLQPLFNTEKIHLKWPYRWRRLTKTWQPPIILTCSRKEANNDIWETARITMCKTSSIQVISWLFSKNAIRAFMSPAAMFCLRIPKNLEWKIEQSM